MDQRRSYFQEETPHIHSVPPGQKVLHPVKSTNACIKSQGEQENEHCPQPPYLVRIILAEKPEPVLQQEIIEWPEDVWIGFHVKRSYCKIKRNKQQQREGYTDTPAHFPDPLQHLSSQPWHTHFPEVAEKAEKKDEKKAGKGNPCLLPHIKQRYEPEMDICRKKTPDRG